VNFTFNRKRVMIIAGVAGIVLSITTMFLFLSSSNKPVKAPNPVIAKVEDVAKFVNSESFLKMDSQTRGRYTKAVVDRYVDLSSEEQLQATQAMKSLNLDKRAKRKIKETFWTSWTLKQADNFAKLSPAEQEIMLDRWLVSIELIEGKTRLQNALNNTGDFSSKAVGSYTKRGMYFLEITSAEDRTKIARLTGSILNHAREKNNSQK